ncbi:FAD/NAD(P)-binding domain-containing protein, partial [Hesseltinella vesiculosa]
MVGEQKGKLKVTIVGGGLAGLACAIAMCRAGHQVLVLEGGKQLSEVGAGIQVPPNSVRIYEAWGIKDRFLDLVVRPNNINIRRYCTGDINGVTHLNPVIGKRYGHPYWLIHRADCQQLLYEVAIEHGAEVKLNAKVIIVDDMTQAVHLVDGSKYTSDMIIGIRSKIRLAVIPERQVSPRVSSNCAYRATIPEMVMRNDPLTCHFMDDPNANCWVGYQRQVMAYPMRSGKMYNLVLSYPEKSVVGRWNEPRDLALMKRQFEDFDPLLLHILSKITSCSKWTLADLPALTHWVSSSGRVALIGDACHAMLPYLAQGAAQATEDAATLGVLFSYGAKARDIPRLLKMYEDLCRSRVERIQRVSFDTGGTWHLPDGPQQQARDAALKRDAVRSGKSPNKWSDEEFQPWLFGHDAI